MTSAARQPQNPWNNSACSQPSIPLLPARFPGAPFTARSAHQQCAIKPSWAPTKMLSGTSGVQMWNVLCRHGWERGTNPAVQEVPVTVTTWPAGQYRRSWAVNGSMWQHGGRGAGIWKESGACLDCCIIPGLLCKWIWEYLAGVGERRRVGIPPSAWRLRPALSPFRAGCSSCLKTK